MRCTSQAMLVLLMFRCWVRITNSINYYYLMLIDAYRLYQDEGLIVHNQDQSVFTRLLSNMCSKYDFVFAHGGCGAVARIVLASDVLERLTSWACRIFSGTEQVKVANLDSWGSQMAEFPHAVVAVAVVVLGCGVVVVLLQLGFWTNAWHGPGFALGSSLESSQHQVIGRFVGQHTMVAEDCEMMVVVVCWLFWWPTLKKNLKLIIVLVSNHGSLVIMEQYSTCFRADHQQ